MPLMLIYLAIIVLYFMASILSDNKDVRNIIRQNGECRKMTKF